jgi:pimeloyl-ACP methyl ester carboxylesterase
VFDKRGVGLSDRLSEDRPGLFEDRVQDILAVMDAVGSQRAAIMGQSETGAVALLFAATYPERTRAVIAYGTFAGEGPQGPTYPWAPTPGDTKYLEELDRGWGRGVMYLGDMASSRAEDQHYVDWFAKLERRQRAPGPQWPSRAR